MYIFHIKKLGIAPSFFMYKNNELMKNGKLSLATMFKSQCFTLNQTHN